MKYIQLTQEQSAVVDDCDFEELARYSWYAHKKHNTYYAVRYIGRKVIRMHRCILNTSIGLLVDHIDGNGLNNTRNNLRICTTTENNRNVGLRKDNTSGFKGVSFHKLAGRYAAHIQLNGKQLYLGLYATPTLAAKAYNVAAIKLYHNYAWLNNVDNITNDGGIIC